MAGNTSFHRLSFGLVMGIAPAVPLVSLYLNDLDSCMVASSARQHLWCYVRFADDILCVVGASRDVSDDALVQIADSCAPHIKVKVSGAGSCWQFLDLGS
eukprot:TRINITY_DN52351_c0_g1_i1.p2 TRINITY_DN52351_c0_g1~~TRINITY_DN52351_c0_g1_i1.p2  ORF type:complete len:100 (-),score=2.92 TRINITY_DN52351_c0_g1_i1:320-619(-)